MLRNLWRQTRNRPIQVGSREFQWFQFYNLMFSGHKALRVSVATITDAYTKTGFRMFLRLLFFSIFVEKVPCAIANVAGIGGFPVVSKAKKLFLQMVHPLHSPSKLKSFKTLPRVHWNSTLEPSTPVSPRALESSFLCCHLWEKSSPLSLNSYFSQRCCVAHQWETC